MVLLICVSAGVRRGDELTGCMLEFVAAWSQWRRGVQMVTRVWVLLLLVLFAAAVAVSMAWILCRTARRMWSGFGVGHCMIVSMRNGGIGIVLRS